MPYYYSDEDADDGAPRAREKAPPEKKRTLHLSFEKRFKDKVVGFYLPHVMERAKAIKSEKKKVRLFSLGSFGDRDGLCRPWSSVDFDHPSTFDTMAMDEAVKKMVVGDLDRFVERKDFYRRVGKAWATCFTGHPGRGNRALL